MKLLHENTLFGAIEAQEELLENAVHYAVGVALRELGDDIVSFEWANSSLKEEQIDRRAA